MNKLSSEDAAYIAGFIDGEGCISYARYKSGEGVNYQLAVIIGNTNLEVLEWICLVVGEGKPRPTKRKRNSKQMYVVRWCFSVAATLLEQVLPFLKVKRARAALVLDICQKNKEQLFTRGIANFGSLGVPPELQALRQETYLKMKTLNKRGVN
jgi:hypothetical protein